MFIELETISGEIVFLNTKYIIKITQAKAYKGINYTIFYKWGDVVENITVDSSSNIDSLFI